MRRRLQGLLERRHLHCDDRTSLAVGGSPKHWIVIALHAIAQRLRKSHHVSIGIPNSFGTARFLIWIHDGGNTMGWASRRKEAKVLRLNHTRCVFMPRLGECDHRFTIEPEPNGTVVALTPVSLYRYLRGAGLAALGGVLA